MKEYYCTCRYIWKYTDAQIRFIFFQTMDSYKFLFQMLICSISVTCIKYSLYIYLKNSMLTEIVWSIVFI